MSKSKHRKSEHRAVAASFEPELGRVQTQGVLLYYLQPLPSVFGRNLECEPVRKWTPERNALGHMPARLKRAGMGNQMASSSANPCRKNAHRTDSAAFDNKPKNAFSKMARMCVALQCCDTVKEWLVRVCNSRGVLLDRTHACFKPPQVWNPRTFPQATSVLPGKRMPYVGYQCGFRQDACICIGCGEGLAAREIRAPYQDH
jgi:hypothetical protein